MSRPTRRTWIIVTTTAVIVFAVLAVVTALAPEPRTDVSGQAAVSTLLDGVHERRGVIGEADAPVRITEYLDLRCSHCREHSAAHIPSIIEGLVADGSASFERRMLPVTTGSDGTTTQAFLAAEAALAARDQDRLWAFSELFLANQQDPALDYVSPAFLDNVAQGAGLDVARFRRARADAALHAAEIQRARADAVAAGITHTPSFTVSGPGGTTLVSAADATAEGLAGAVREAMGR